MTTQAAAAGADRDGWDVPGAFGRWLAPIAVAIVLVIGGASSLLLYRQADVNARDHRADLATRASRTLMATIDELDAAFSGANALVDTDGTVDQRRFESFASRVVTTTELRTVGYEPVVSDADRAAFEQRTGGPIKQVGPGGALVPADRRPAYAPVQWSLPALDTAAAVRGFDILSDPTRAAAASGAVEAGTIGFSAPVPVQPTGTQSFFVVQPLYAPGSPLDTPEQRRAAVVGYVASAVTGTRLLSATVADLPVGTQVQISDQGQLLVATTPAPSGGKQVSVAGGGRTWLLTLQRPRPSHLVALGTAVGTLAAAALVGLVLARNRRQTEELRASALSVRLLGQLSEHLAGAETVDEMADVAARHGPITVNAQRVTIAVVEPGTPDRLRLLGADGHLVEDTPRPMTDAWHHNTGVFVNDGNEMRRRYPQIAPLFAGRGTEAVAALPLCRPSGELIGVLTFEWARRRRFGTRTRTTLSAAAKLCQQSVVRAQAQERRRATAAALSTLGQRLSVARTFSEVCSEVIALAPAASGAPIVAVGLPNATFSALRLMRSPIMANDPGAGMFIERAIDPNGLLVERLRRGERVQFRTGADIDVYPQLRELLGPRVDRLSIFPLVDSAGEVNGVLVFVYADSPRFGVWNEPGRMMTIADLTALTLERATLYQRQSDLVLELQRRTLPELPEIAGMAVAARYLPSSSALGLGGDWYDVQRIGADAVGLVVGDVVGHGIEAIADMTEIRTTVSTLLRTELDLARVVSRSTDLLARDSPEIVFATAVLMIVDCPARRLHYVRAGHPPPMVRTPAGEVLVLEGAGTTPIGLAGAPAAAGVVAVDPGALIVAYTDGLIERRDESIDVGLRRLHDCLAHTTTPVTDVERIADEVVAACVEGRALEDDVALLVVHVA